MELRMDIYIYIFFLISRTLLSKRKYYIFKIDLREEVEMNESLFFFLFFVEITG